MGGLVAVFAATLLIIKILLILTVPLLLAGLLVLAAGWLLSKVRR